MNQINIKEYFKTEKEKLRLAVIEPPSLTIVDATDGDVGNQIYIKKKIGVDEKLSRSQGINDLETEFELSYIIKFLVKNMLFIEINKLNMQLKNSLKSIIFRAEYQENGGNYRVLS